MSYEFEVRVNGVIKMADRVTEMPAFHFDGTTATIVAELENEPPVPDVPRMNLDEINQRLSAEGESPEGANEGAEGESADDSPGQAEKATEQGVDGESSSLDDKPRAKRGGGRRKHTTAEEADPNAGKPDAKSGA